MACSVRLQQARDLGHDPASPLLQVGVVVGDKILEVADAQDETGIGIGVGIIDGSGADGEDAVGRRGGEVGCCGRGPHADEHGVASAGDDLGDAAAVVLPRGCACDGSGGRGDLGVVGCGEAAEEERRRAGARGEPAEERHGRRGAEDGELDVSAAEPGVGEDAADEGVVEDGEDEVGEVDLDGVGGGR